MKSVLHVYESAPSALLTIAIPTYNRADYLARLLETLRRELADVEDLVQIVISDNGSTDKTAEVISDFKAVWPSASVLSQTENIGMDGNFHVCAQSVKGDFFWFMGDDDLPVQGAIPALLEMISREQPDLVIVSSRWLLDINTVAHEAVASPLKYRRMSRDALGRRMHVWSTFLTGVIVRRTVFLKNSEKILSLDGTNLTQLSWVMERLREGECFLYVETVCVLATAGNTGGYSVVTVFGEHFPRIVRDNLSSDHGQRLLARQIVLRTILNFLPGLLWGLRIARIGDFQPENVKQALKPELGNHPLTPLLLVPISYLPMPISWILMIAARSIGRLVSTADHLRSRC